MGFSLRWYRSRLYRKAALAVIPAVCLAVVAFAQYAKKAPKTKGPRALGVLELAANGKAHLIAVTIMIDGKFYDAGAYKADPVPMALQRDTVYEAVKTGNSQGLFTVGGALRGKEGWIGDGKWRSTAQMEADKKKFKAEQEKLAQKAPEVEQGPPKLKRGPPTGDKTPPTATPPAGSDKPSSTSDKPTPTSDNSTKSTPSAAPSTGSEKKPSEASAPSASDADPNRPILRRQPVEETSHEQTKSGSEPEALKGPIELIPAISDADGPDPRPYAYQMKPEEEQARLKKMLAMASDEIKSRAVRAEISGSSGPKSDKNVRPTRDVQFQSSQMRVFDLSNSNVPVLVLTGEAKVPTGARDLMYMTTIVAREDIYGDLHKVFAQTTDNQHLDAIPKYELIDAVDADGDGRGELLFRMNWDNGSAFGVYRVIGDRLWPLFEGKPGS
jgi:hypothetical protein